VNTEGFACPNRKCLYFGLTDASIHALVGDDRHGRAERIQTFRCQACRITFSARRDTPLLCADSPFWAVAPGESPRAQSPPVVSGGGADLRPGEEKLSTTQADTGLAGDAPGNRGRSQSRLTGNGPLGEVEYRFYRAGESDGPPWGSSAGSSYMGHGPADPTPAGPPRVVARLLPFCAPPCLAAGSAHAATRTRGQSFGATLPTAYASDGSRENHPTVDGLRAALVSLAKGVPLRGIEARWGAVSCRGKMSRVFAETLGGSLARGREGLSGLPHHKKSARRRFAEG